MLLLVQVTQEALSCRDLTRMDNLIFLVCTIKSVYKLNFRCFLKKTAELNKAYSSNLTVFGKNKPIFKGSLGRKNLHCLHSLLL